MNPKMLSTYGLTRLPFSKDIPASEMLDTEALQSARERLKAALEGRASAVVTGDSGCGKTCLLRAIEEDLPQGPLSHPLCAQCDGQPPRLLSTTVHRYGTG